MPKETYVQKNFSGATLLLIEQANKIIAEYADQGFNLTLRQLYYQFVARDLIPNNQRSYKRLGEHVNNGRLAGLIDWKAIVDRTRNVRSPSTWGEPVDILRSAWSSYAEDKWADQPRRVEVWIEKDALVGVIEGICTDLQVPYFSCRGYTSQSEVWAASKRFRAYHAAGQLPSIIHLGDHDPSGIDMTRDTGDRLGMFMYKEGSFPVDRVALNMDQINKYDPPPNPAKLTDSRATGYIDHFGTSSWELDALEPQVMADLIRDAVLDLRDEEKWSASLDHEKDNKARLKQYYLQEKGDDDGEEKTDEDD